MSNLLKSRTKNEKTVFGSYSKRAIAEQSTKNTELSPQLLLRALLRNIKKQQIKDWVTVSYGTGALNIPQSSTSMTM